MSFPEIILIILAVIIVKLLIINFIMYKDNE